ncbi:MAG: hypothetical protein A2741_01675 [Candidatus Zambryskibacteria bacterium RIFCSPHIGHO2_01_FULL_43_27]|uniref:UDP-N-acetylmuramoyl-tripeptide--D-alanyl-D-alanine ligase n=1 Tax=Candidatus Zambryskibacteria bacterium RIFCSPLOWO2_01_FULL_43_17 TaxID=1802760 RepID=A0A1G2U0D0_9BACT|nr:MAG: hypothetical protein A2741_01675 [Candidatus Zambryskibacteria bacterium RIFCSPHIGHO2_01_FULL_43_27]OHB00693.1 MAG: hypothetical protein A3E93_03015 [Candidatus Zambryskibacteria bacterium RIFCSPHIGHO2_12_FULL_43_12b]OHB02991.1 MAG: hypothetical protein A2920_02880 [Candidatus Zambryskibacteria bacterium RIFCSPLOWO2_01_FULL_43_17]
MKSVLKNLVVLVLTWEAKLVLKKYKPKIVAVTGSVGKTSAKDAIYTVLSGSLFARKSDKSFNSEIGVPLTILGCRNGWNNPFIWLRNIIEGIMLIILPNHYPKWLVLEVGADRPGDIENLSKWIAPDIAVVTKLADVPVHVEFFEDAEALYREKAFLVRAVKNDGVVILNSDDEDVLSMREQTTARTLLFGTKSPAEVIATSYRVLYEETDMNKTPNGIVFDVSHGKEFARINIFGGLGLQHLYSALAGVAVGRALNIKIEKISKSFFKHETPRGRMKILRGVKDSILIDDSYNSSPLALMEALNTLELIETTGRKIAVLGDMLELGRFSPDEHKKAGEKVAKVAQILFTIGVRARGIAEGALNAGMSEKDIFQFEDSGKAGKELEQKLKSYDVVLVKGSQGIRTERVMEEIMAEPERKDELLVRQEREWIRR